MNILFFGTASYDKASFTKELASYPEIKIDFTETNLTPMTAALARGYDAVCAFVNADCGAMTLEILAGFGVKLVLMRCAGFDAVNVEVAKDLGITVTRVPAYSPEAIAEHAMGLALAANRRICKGYIRVRENDFSLNGPGGQHPARQDRRHHRHRPHRRRALPHLQGLWHEGPGLRPLSQPEARGRGRRGRVRGLRRALPAAPTSSRSTRSSTTRAAT